MVFLDSLKKKATTLDRTRSDSRNSRPKILGLPERDESTAV